MQAHSSRGYRLLGVPAKVFEPLSSLSSTVDAAHTVCECEFYLADGIIEIDCLFDGIEFHVVITRARFEELCSEVIPIKIVCL